VVVNPSSPALRSRRHAPSGTGRRADAPQRPRTPVGLGPALRRAWVGYQQQLDEELAKAGFDDRGFPDGRVRTELGEDVFAGLYRLVEKLAGDDDLRLSDYLRKMSHF
jgi:hypothetical protein